LLGNGVNHIYFKAGNGLPANVTLWVDDIKFIRAYRVAVRPAPRQSRRRPGGPHGSRVAVAFVPADQTSPLTSQNIARSTTMG
jgi:hypothetical protein